MKKPSHAICENCRIKSEVWERKKNLGQMINFQWQPLASKAANITTIRVAIKNFFSFIHEQQKTLRGKKDVSAIQTFFS